MGRSIVRLKDIADKTGFSTNTVSLALRESPRIPEHTRKLIRAAAAELNYLPNHVAKSLVSRETKTIGLVLTDISNPTLTGTAQALETALAARGYGTLFATSNNNVADERRVVEMFRSRQVDGMLIYPASHRALDHIRPLRAANYPVVLLVADPDAGIDTVAMDERRGAWKATRHLIELGHTRIGLMDGGHKIGNSEKSDGYYLALEEAGIAADPRLHVDPHGQMIQHGHAAMARFMGRADPPTAVFTANDSLALGALSYCDSHGIAVPGQMAIVGFDNIEFGKFAATPLSSVDYAVADIANGAVERLMTLIRAGDQLPDPAVSLIEPDLIVRRSSSGTA